MLESITIRPIEKIDNQGIAKIIRNTLTEFKANKPGTVYYDSSTDFLFELFTKTPNSQYFVALNNNELVGGAGIFPTPNLPAGTCELVKMYLLPHVRGIGLGKKLIATAIEWAKATGYNQIYLETMPELNKAVKVYEKLGFHYLSEPLGNSGHHGCDLWMLKEIINNN
ncbi:MAG: GNAT family N-acetyltransferase [Chitinophagaceae bacterium]